MATGPENYVEAQRLLGKQTRGNISTGETFQGAPTTDEILRGIGHAILAAAAASALNVRRNGAVELADEAAGWERVLG